MSLVQEVRRGFWVFLAFVTSFIESSALLRVAYMVSRKHSFVGSFLNSSVSGCLLCPGSILHDPCVVVSSFSFAAFVSQLEITGLKVLLCTCEQHCHAACNYVSWGFPHCIQCGYKWKTCSCFNCLRSYLWYATKCLVIRRTACHRQLCC